MKMKQENDAKMDSRTRHMKALYGYLNDLMLIFRSWAVEYGS